MITFIFGDNPDLIKRKTSEFTKVFLEESQDAKNNYDQIVLDEIDDKLSPIGIIKSPPFLSEKRLVVLVGACSMLKKVEALKYIDALINLPESNSVIFVDNISSAKIKKSFIFKEFFGKPSAKILACEKFSDTSIVDWASEYAKNIDLQIEKQDLLFLIRRINPGIDILENELLKIASYSAGRICTKSDIELLTSASGEDVIFMLMDAISGRDAEKVIDLLGRQRLLGCDDSFLFSMLLRQIRVMATIKDACSRFGADGASISRDTGIHPYVVQKTIRQVSRMSQLEIKKAHDLCFFLDNKVKNGQISTKETLDIAVASSCALTF